MTRRPVGGSEWLRCRAWIVPALEDTTEQELTEKLELGWAQLWPGERAAMVTYCTRNPARLHVWLAGGELSELLAMIPGVAAWGRAMGCDWATIHGRKGWARLLSGHGFEDRDGELWKALK